MQQNYSSKKWSQTLKLLAASTFIFTSLVTFTPTVQAATLMRFGSTGNNVVTLQKELVNLGYTVGPIDGIFGSKTFSAVENFQQNDHLQVDGIVGPLTQSALDKDLTTQAPATNSSQIEGIIAKAKSLLGTPYLWGGTTPGGFDCSGFTQYVFASQGINLPRTSQDQAKVGTSVSYGDLKPGDLVFFSTAGNGTIDHVGIYLGNSQFISATTHKGVAIYPLTSSYWLNAYKGAQRVL
ncbi:NlpC/P60 family protein [Desulfosporosinus sp. FKA]|uniref:C40 family peptidase n=1 Tax=Desulfosporosinus sp. FKA TaxID=1969834 RepID=UPI000B4A2FBD|nr:NlpC/P60 family protein [Desulfosporosinus sp. FKA]